MTDKKAQKIVEKANPGWEVIQPVVTKSDKTSDMKMVKIRPKISSPGVTITKIVIVDKDGRIIGESG
jgi:hypothetical protein